MKCPKCNSEEVDAMTPRTVYDCGSSDYDQRPDTFIQSDKCKEKDEVEKLAIELWKSSDDRTGNPPYIYSLGVEHGYNKAKEEESICINCDEEKLTHNICMDCIGMLIKENQVPEVRKMVEDDVEKLAEQYAKNHGMMSYVFPDKYDGFIAGYNKAKENTYTEEQVREAIEIARDGIRITRINEWETEKEFDYTSEEIIQSLKQPK